VPNAPQTHALRDAAAVDPLGNGRYAVNLSEQYTVVGRPNGGYLQCVLANAALAEAAAQGGPHIHATAVTTNFIGAPELGPAVVVATVRRIGRGASFVHVALEQNGAITNESLITLGTLSERSAPRYHDAVPPILPPLEDCPRSEPNGVINILGAQDQRLDPACTTFARGELSEKAEIRGWMRLDDGQSQWDAWSLLFASDALPPATFPIGSTGWVPTLQLSSYIRSIPSSEWLKVRQWCVVIEDGLVDERCELFDDRDQLVASASQLAMVRFNNPTN